MQQGTIGVAMFAALAVAFVFLRFDPWLAVGACLVILIIGLAAAVVSIGRSEAREKPESTGIVVDEREHP